MAVRCFAAYKKDENFVTEISAFTTRGRKEKIQGTYFKICLTYFKISQTYFLLPENPPENRGKKGR